MRSVVPAGGCAVGVRAGGTATGAGDGVRLFPVDVGGDDPVPASTDLLIGHWSLISGWGRVPRVLVWDNESADRVLARWPAATDRGDERLPRNPGHPGGPVSPDGSGGQGLGGTGQCLSGDVVPARPLVRLATGLQRPVGQWLERANTRRHRALGCRPADRWDADRAAMLPLPPVAPMVGWRQATRLPRNHYVRLDSNDYSVHPSVVGCRVEVTADAEQVRVFCDGRMVGRHERCWAAHQSITGPIHRQAAADLRAVHRQAAPPAITAEVEHRPTTKDQQVARGSKFSRNRGVKIRPALTVPLKPPLN